MKFTKKKKIKQTKQNKKNKKTHTPNFFFFFTKADHY